MYHYAQPLPQAFKVAVIKPLVEKSSLDPVVLASNQILTLNGIVLIYGNIVRNRGVIFV